MEYVTVGEGSIKLRVPRVEKLLRKNPVFYNPVMSFSRDISVAVARILKPKSYCDALAGSGARGLRISKEAGVEVTLNDLNSVACELMRENARLNDLDVLVSNDDLNHFLSDKKFDFVDVDPFGPPVRYLDSAVRSMPKKGFLGVAATDTSVLCGRYPRACRRKYDSTPLRTDYYNEVGLRVLLGYVARNAVRYDYGTTFLFSHCTHHYFRAYVRLDRGRSHVRATQNNVGFLQHCFKCLDKSYATLDGLRLSCDCGGSLSTAGPIWVGEFALPSFCGELASELMNMGYGHHAELVDVVSGEQVVLKPYFDLHKVCGSVGVPAPPMSFVFDRLMEGGFRVCRTHFSGVGLRTDAGVGVLKGIIT